MVVMDNLPTEYTGLGNLGFLWVIGGLLLAGFIACVVVGAGIGKAWYSENPPLIKKVIDNATKSGIPKLKDPYLLKGKK